LRAVWYPYVSPFLLWICRFGEWDFAEFFWGFLLHLGRESTGVDPECRYRYQSSFPQFWPFLALMVMVWVAWGLARFGGGSSSGSGGKVEGKGTEGS